MEADIAQPAFQRRPATRAIRIGKRLRNGLNRLLALTSLVPHDPFISPAHVPGSDRLADCWREVRAELDMLMREREAIPALGEISPDHRRIARNSAWRSYFFVGHGYRVEENCRHCPATAALIDSIPGVVVAFFSIFEPGTHVPAHRGVTKAMLNVHLPLIVPPGPGRCEIAAGGEVRQWREGEVLVLDETWRHEAWNFTGQPRVVLFLQVMRPMSWPGRLISSLLLKALRHTSYVQDLRSATGATPMRR